MPPLSLWAVFLSLPGARAQPQKPPAGNATNDSNVVVEEKRKRRPLPQRETQHWLTITAAISGLSLFTTKGGNYFYILIDRAAEGEQTITFLNQVDEEPTLWH